jgi:hypothetical protein
MMDDLDLAARQLGELVDELLRGLRGAVLGRVDVAHRQVLALGQRTVRGECRCGQEQADRQQSTYLGYGHLVPPDKEFASIRRAIGLPTCNHCTSHGIAATGIA